MLRKILILINIILFCMYWKSSGVTYVKYYTTGEDISINFDNYNKNTKYFMILEIPKLNVKKEIYRWDDSKNDINKNIQLMKESTTPNKENGNIILGAHSGYGKLAIFKDLDKLKMNDEIFIYYKEDKFSYIVEDIYQDKKDGNITIHRDKKRKTLILYTCNPQDKETYLIIIAYEKKS